MAEFDTSVNLKILDSLTITSELGPEDFEKAVFEAVSAGRTISDLGCGRIMADWSLFMRTRYVLCDIYEEGDAVQQEDGRQDRCEGGGEEQFRRGHSILFPVPCRLLVPEELFHQIQCPLPRSHRLVRGLRRLARNDSEEIRLRPEGSGGGSPGYTSEKYSVVFRC